MAAFFIPLLHCRLVAKNGHELSVTSYSSEETTNANGNVAIRPLRSITLLNGNVCSPENFHPGRFARNEENHSSFGAI